MKSATPDPVQRRSVMIPGQYVEHHTLNLKASLLCGLYLEARKLSDHQVAFDAASFHLSSMLGSEAIPVSDAPVLIDALNEESAQLLRCVSCNSVFLSLADVGGTGSAVTNCLIHR